MSHRRIAAAVFLICIACSPRTKPRPAATPGGPQVRAAVLTIVTVLQPGARSFTHTLVIGGNRARSGDELDHWRLFDLAKGEVTFVDDVARTYRTVSLQNLLADRRAADTQPLPDTIPLAQFAVTNATRALQGVMAKESIVRLGAYQRHLWIGSHPLIPPGLFAMMEASRPITTPVEGAMRDVDEALLEVRGFPLAEHAELPYGKQKLVLDRTVSRIEQRSVAANWLNVRPDYRDVTPRPAKPVSH